MTFIYLTSGVIHAEVRVRVSFLPPLSAITVVGISIHATTVLVSKKDVYELFFLSKSNLFVCCDTQRQLEETAGAQASDFCVVPIHQILFLQAQFLFCSKQCNAGVF